jgi:hypothetical protein
MSISSTHNINLTYLHTINTDSSKNWPCGIVCYHKVEKIRCAKINTQRTMVLVETFFEKLKNAILKFQKSQIKF